MLFTVPKIRAPRLCQAGVLVYLISFAVPVLAQPALSPAGSTTSAESPARSDGGPLNLLGESAAPVAGRFVESAANRAVDLAAPAVVSGVEALPGGAILHGVVDGVVTGAVKGEELDVGRTVFSAAGAVTLGAIIAPEVVGSAIVVDMAGSYLGELAWDNRRTFPGGAALTRGFVDFSNWAGTTATAKFVGFSNWIAASVIGR